MKKLLLCMITMIAVVGLCGCGSSKAKYSKHLELYREYYEEELTEEYGDYCLADIFLDKDGLPMLWTMTGDSELTDVDIVLYAADNNEVVEIMDVGIYRGGDELKEVYLYSDGIIRVETHDSGKIEWYQISQGNAEMIAFHKEETKINWDESESSVIYMGDENGEYEYFEEEQEKYVLVNTYEEQREDVFEPGYTDDFPIVFLTEKEEIEVNFAKLEMEEYEELYEKLSKEYYNRKKYDDSDRYAKGMGGASLAYGLNFLRSPRLPIYLDDYAYDFDDKIEELMDEGKMGQDEFLVWQTNYINENGGDEDGNEIGLHLLYRGFDLFEQLELDGGDVSLERMQNLLGTGREHEYYPYTLWNDSGADLMEAYLAYVYFTETWNMLEQVELLESIPLTFLRDFLEKGIAQKVERYLAQFNIYAVRDEYEMGEMVKDYLMEQAHTEFTTMIKQETKEELLKAYKSCILSLDKKLGSWRDSFVKDPAFLFSIYRVYMERVDSSGNEKAGYLVFDMNGNGPFILCNYWSTVDLYVYAKGDVELVAMSNFGANWQTYLPEINAFEDSGGRDGTTNCKIFTLTERGIESLLEESGYEYIINWSENKTVDEAEHNITDYTSLDEEGNPRSYTVTSNEEWREIYKKATKGSERIVLHEYPPIIEGKVTYNSLDEAWEAYWKADGDGRSNEFAELLGFS